MGKIGSHGFDKKIQPLADKINGYKWLPANSNSEHDPKSKLVKLGQKQKSANNAEPEMCKLFK